MSLKKKLFVAFSAFMLIIVAIGAYAVFSLQNITNKTMNITSAWLPSITSNTKMLDATASYRISLLRHALAATPELMSRYEGDIKRSDDLMKAGIAEYRDLVETGSYSSETARQKDRDDLKKLEDTWNKAFKEGEKTIALSRALKTEEATADMKNRIEPIVDTLEKDLVRPLLAFNEEGAKKVSGEVNQLQAQSILILSVVVVIAVIVGTIIMISMIKNIMGSVGELTKVFAVATKGDLRQRGVPRSRDELGKLIVDYNALLDSTSGMIKQIQSTAEKVAASSDELTASADQSAQVTEQIAESIAHVAGLSAQEVTAVDEATGTIEHISAGIEQSAAGVGMAAERTKQALDTAKLGRESIDSAVGQMNNIERTVNHSAAVVAKLGERSKEIGQIVDTISGIAGQTNLLALNAAIEAARAGEQGKGFAVVAEEVRKLAEQSQEAAKQIRELISGIQVDTDQAVIAMDEGTKEVRTGAEVVNKAGIAFGEILEMVAEVNLQAVEVANTMEDIAKGSENVVSSVQKIDQSSKTTAAEAETVSAATEEQAAAMEQIASSSRGLADLAQRLQEASNRFKI